MAKRGKELAEREAQLHQYAGEDRIVSSHELAEELAESAESAASIPTGVASLDRICDGVEPGEMVVVTGPTGEGKTTLLMTITQNFSAQKIQSAWFTLEVTPRQFINKMTMRGDLPLFYMPRQNQENHIQWIEDRIIEAKVKHNIQAVFIDHIHQIFSLHKVSGGNVSLEIGDMVGKIKDLAVTHNLVIFLIAHMRDDSQNPSAEPRKEYIRDSGLISRLADTILAVWRIPNMDTESTKRKPLEEQDNWAKVRVLKNRRTGKHGTFFAIHDQHHLLEVDAFGDPMKPADPTLV